MQESKTESQPHEGREDNVDVPLLDLLYGIEIEFLGALAPELAGQKETSVDEDVIDQFSATLKECGLDHVAAWYHDNSTYHTWTLTTDSSLQPKYYKSELPDHFPNAFIADPLDDYGWKLAGLELISPPKPVLSLSKEPVTQPGWLEVDPYFQALSSHNDMSEPEHFAFAGDTCGFHIHIGLPNNEILPLPLLKHLAILTLIYEPVFSSLHPYCRTPDAKTQASEFCQSNRIAFRPDAHTCKDEFLETVEFKRRVMECETIGQLAWLMGAPYALDDELKELYVESESSSSSSSSSSSGSSSDSEEDSDGEKQSDGHRQPASEEEPSTSSNSNGGVRPDMTARNDSDPKPDSGPSNIDTIVTDEAELVSVRSPMVEIDRPENVSPLPQPERAAATRASPEGSDGNDAESIRGVVYPRGEKYKIVRWELLARPDGKHTIEFRQPAGDLDSVAAAYTVQLYVALVRAAERRANLEAQGLQPGWDEDPGTFAGLISVLELCDESETYWRTREVLMEEAHTEEALMEEESMDTPDLTTNRCEACLHWWKSKNS